MRKLFILIGLFIVAGLSAQVTIFDNDTVRNSKAIGYLIDNDGVFNDSVTALRTDIGSSSVDAVARDMLQDSLGWKIVDAETYGDSATDATAHIQAKIDAAIDGTVYIPPGNYFLSDSLLVEENTKIIGAGWGNKGNGTRLFIRNNKTGIHFYTDDGAGGHGFELGASIGDLMISGAGEDSTDNHGIVVNGSQNLDIEKVRITGCGGKAIWLGSIFHTDKVTISKSKIDYNYGDGLYGLATGNVNEINAIRVLDNEFTANGGHSINVWPTANFLVKDNIIQGNDSCGINMVYTKVSTLNAIAIGTRIIDNYFEDNGGGSGYFRAYSGAGADDHLFYGITIKGNYCNEDAGTINKPDQNGVWTFAGGGTNYVHDVDIKDNSYSTDIYIVDGGGILDHTCEFEIPYDSYDLFTDMYNASPDMSGGMVVVNTIVAGTGINEDIIHGCILVALGSAIDITATDQIIDGYNGQILTIMGYSDTNTLTLDDGNNLQLDGGVSWVGGSSDVLVLRYDRALGFWNEVSRSDN